jgi:HPt (histidine-containing phosphotransfer) domain-containing protein
VPRKRSRELLQLFLRTVPEQVRALEQAAEGADLAAVRARAHRLKGSAGSVGAAHLSELCEHLELASERSDLAALVPLAQQIQQELAQVERALQRELKA